MLHTIANDLTFFSFERSFSEEFKASDTLSNIACQDDTIDIFVNKKIPRVLK